MRSGICRVLLLCLPLLLVACNRQYLVTVTNQAEYDPRLREGTVQLQDADLQGCLNLALRQQRLENPLEITALSCARADIQTLEGIQQFQQLRFLDLAGNRITDLQPVASLPQLSALSVPDNRITDLSPLFGMRSLSAVILTGNNGIACAQLDRLAQRIGDNLTRPEVCDN